jgi:peptidoglycan/LPS O-acetylase OafA/YrhL
VWIAGEQGFSFPANTIGYLVTAIAYGCLVFVCVTDQGSNHLVCRAARWRPLRSIGRYSYAMYIIHVLVIRALQAVTASIFLPRLFRIQGAERIPHIAVPLAFMGACLAVSYLLALLSWNVFEKHFLRLKKYFPYQLGSVVSPKRETVASPVGALAD